ncbi:Crp/Fnr family transcriptional regulator [Hydrogenophaga sp. XSHU_21]
MNTTLDVTSNRLLAALPAEVMARWRPELEPVELQTDQVLYEPGRAQSHVYFPADATVALLYLTITGKSAEVAQVGNEGIVGFPLFMGGDTTSSLAVAQRSGGALRLTSRFIKDEFDQCRPVVQLLLSYTEALITQMAQTALCNRHHSVEQQLSKWLLWSLDQTPGSEIRMTHEHAANMLGVRRESVTAAAARLQRAGLISCGRGRVKVLSRGGLELRACACYRLVKAEYDRLLPDTSADNESLRRPRGFHACDANHSPRTRS